MRQNDQRAGIAEATVVRMENGQREPRIPTIRKLAEALGIDARELMGD